MRKFIKDIISKIRYGFTDDQFYQMLKDNNFDFKKFDKFCKALANCGYNIKDIK